MSRDIFTDVSGSRPSRTHHGIAWGSISRAQNGDSSTLVPMDPKIQRLMDRIDAERDAERARKEVEMDTPENRQKAFEAEVAERKRKRIDFDFSRAIPRFLAEGWTYLGGNFPDEEVRVYTTDHRRYRFWGIKPVGMGMDEFWEQNDPEIGRYEDNVPVTWANALIPPPVNPRDENNPVIWAGPGLNPDLAPPEPTVAKASPSTKAAAKSKRHPESADVNPTHRVRKSMKESPQVKKTTRKSLLDKIDAGHLGLEDQVQEVTEAVHASGTFKRPRSRPAIKAKSVMQDNTSATPKRPRGHPSAKIKPAVIQANPIPSIRPRGRPPVKGKPIERPSTQKKKTPTVKGNARVTKSSQKKPRPSAPSTHKMRTRGGGPAELVQLQ